MSVEFGIIASLRGYFIYLLLLVKYVGIDYEDLVRASFRMFDSEYRELSNTERCH